MTLLGEMVQLDSKGPLAGGAREPHQAEAWKGSGEAAGAGLSSGLSRGPCTPRCGLAQSGLPILSWMPAGPIPSCPPLSLCTGLWPGPRLLVASLLCLLVT